MSRKMIVTSITVGIIVGCKVLQAFVPEFDADSTIKYILSVAGGWGVMHTASDIAYTAKK